jgi:hypothetical protein
VARSALNELNDENLDDEQFVSCAALEMKEKWKLDKNGNEEKIETKEKP